jgi:hypothetical protein
MLAWLKQCSLMVGLGLLCLNIAWSGDALAATWYPVAEATQGKQQQFVDIDSIEPLSRGHVRVASYYLDARSGTPQKSTYWTEYDCQRRQFRDVEYDGPTGSATWLPVEPDPLNAAAMDYVCGVVAEGMSGKR